MANVNAPFGLRPAKKNNNGVQNMGGNYYYIPSTYGTALYVGDPVVKTRATNTSTVFGYQPGTMTVITKATAGTGNASTGVIVGFLTLQTDQSKQYNPASTERIAIVNDDPGASFYIQDDGVTPLTSTGSAGANFNMIFSTAGSTVNGQSGAQMDSGSIATTSTLQLNVLRLAPIPGNAIGANAIWEVKLNNHTEAPNSAGI